MSMIVKERLLVQCNNCGRKFSITPEELCEEYFSDERPMGIGTTYEFSGEKTCLCGKELYYKVISDEYPVGGYNYHDVETGNCTPLNKPDVKVEWFPEELVSVYDEILNNPEYIDQLDSYEFERFVASVYEKQGFEVHVTQRTRDGGKDIIAYNEVGGIRYATYFECKHKEGNNPVGVDVLRSLSGVIERDRINKGVIVTSSYFSDAVKKEVQDYGGRIDLVDRERLIKLMKGRQ